MHEAILQALDDIFDWEFKHDIYLSLTSDYAKFVVVDGEEGDYGIIQYFHGEELFGIKHVHGGDIEDRELTPYGKKVLGDLMIAKIKKWQTSV